MTDDSLSWHEDTPIVLEHFMADNVKGIEDTMGDESSIFLGLEPDDAAGLSSFGQSLVRERTSCGERLEP